MRQLYNEKVRNMGFSQCRDLRRADHVARMAKCEMHGTFCCIPPPEKRKSEKAVYTKDNTEMVS
jgi:hypothetical protein